MSMNEKKTLVCVTVMVAVFVREGAEADDATLMLAADTAAQHRIELVEHHSGQGGEDDQFKHGLFRLSGREV